MNDSGMVLLYASDKLYQAELVRDLLAENGIESELLNKIDSLFLIGEAEVYVDPEDEERAKHLISEIR